MSQPAGEAHEHLSRIAAKPGVRSTLILSKVDGAIIQSSGLELSPPKASSEVQQDEQQDDGQNSAEVIAKMVFRFIQAAGDFASSVQAGDEVQLLRLRTKKNEIMIVPDAKYLLVVVQDAPKTN